MKQIFSYEDINIPEDGKYILSTTADRNWDRIQTE
jgi:hypothetical protein